MPWVAAAAKIGRARSMLSSMLQLMFLRENVSEAATNTATSSACAASAASKPFMLGVSTGYRVPGLRWMRLITSAASAICGTHLGETNAVASIAGKPASARASISATFASVGTIAFSFCKPSRGPTSTSRTALGSVAFRVMTLRDAVSVASSAIDDAGHRLPSLEPPDLPGDLRDRIFDHGHRRRVRRQRDLRMMPERMARGQRLVAKHVERGAGEMTFVEQCDKILVHDDVARGRR